MSSSTRKWHDDERRLIFNCQLLNFQSDNDSNIHRAKILSDMHLRTLKSKAKLVQETEKVSKQLEVKSINE